MEDLLYFHRNKLCNLDVERFISPLKERNILTVKDVEEIRFQSSPSFKINFLLDILQGKGPEAYQVFFTVLESVYPNILTMMLVAGTIKQNVHFNSHQGFTTDSEREENRDSSISLSSVEQSSNFGRSMSSCSTVAENVLHGRSGSSVSMPLNPGGAVISHEDYNKDQNNMKLTKSELKVLAKDRDIMKKSLKERDETLKRLGNTSQCLVHPDLSPDYGTCTKQSSNAGEQTKSPREVDTLKLCYEKALMDVKIFHKKNLEMNRKFEATMQDVDYYRKQERVAYTRVQTLRRQYEEIASDKHKLENEISSLQKMLEEDRKEISELRRHQEETLALKGSDETLHQLYLTTFRKYETLKGDYESVKKRYSDLATAHSSNLSKVDLSQEEIKRLKKQCEDAVSEKNCLKQQCTEAIRQWDTALRDKNKLQEELLKVQERNEELGKEINAHLVQNQNLNKEFKRLQSERNAAMREYTLVMSERDTVHKEMDKLQEELSLATSKIKSVEAHTFENTKERDSLILELETLKREVASSLNDRDKAIRECNELRERYGTPADVNKQWDHVKDYDTYKQERELNRSEFGNLTGISSHEMFTKAHKERLENLDQANQEIDRLRKNAEKVQSDLEEAKRETEVSKRRRDWAFCERDKIVLERESIRAHCDKLRHERDRAVSDLAEALRDSDDMMKQRNEASKQLKELKDKIDANAKKMGSTVPRSSTTDHRSSKDSAMNTENEEWEVETMQLQIGVLSSERELGFEVCGRTGDSRNDERDGTIYVSSISSESPFDGKLRLNDHILRINGLECTGSSPANVYNAVLKCRGWVQLTVRRRRPEGVKNVRTTHLHCPIPAQHGLVLKSCVFISDLLPGSPAEREGSLAVGDRILSINGKIVDCTATAENLLNSSGETIQIITVRSADTPFTDGLPSASGHNMTEDDKMAAAVSLMFPAKESIAHVPGNTNRHSKDLSLKFKCEEKRLGSNELVYTVTKIPEEKPERTSSGGPWGQIKSIVTQRRHSKERSDECTDNRDAEAAKGGREDREKDDAIAQLDSVLENYKHRICSSTGTTKRVKKKNKENSGGTWPKYRGSAVITLRDINLGGNKPLIQRKQRPPLSMYVPSLPRDNNLNSNIIRNSMIDTRSVLSNPSSHVFSVLQTPEKSEFQPYREDEIYVNPQSHSFAEQPLYSCARREGLSRKDRLRKEPKDIQDHQGSPDTSLDFSVKSGNVGKEELEYYVKKNLGSIVKYPTSDSEGSSLHMQPTSLPPVYISRPSPLHQVGERLQSHSLNSHSHSGLYPASSAPLRMSPFPLYPYTHHHNHPHTIHGPVPSYSSPNYSSPVSALGGSPNFLSRSRSGEFVFSSSLPDKNTQDVCNPYERSTAYSPTNVGSYVHSGVSSIDMGHISKRSLYPNHLHGPKAFAEESPPHVFSGLPSYNDYQRGVSTMPRKKNGERIRIPSNSSITSVKTSQSMGGYNVIGDSFSEGEDQSIPEGESHIGTSFPITQISHSIHNQIVSQCKKAQPGDIRNIYIEKDSEPLGIQIRCLSNGGVFVASVTKASIAETVGLTVGDQLLEVCGINMRSATKQLASTVLSQCGNSVTILVQFNPEKYQESECWEGSSSGSSFVIGSPSGTATPQNSPRNSRSPVVADEDDDLPHSGSSTLRSPLNVIECLEPFPTSARSTLTRPQATHVLNLLNRKEKSPSQTSSSNDPTFPIQSLDGRSHSSGSFHKSEPRRIHIEMNGCHNLGVQMVGGNALGIFVHAVSSDSPAAKSDLRVGDRILEFNGIDLRQATAEQAACELSKPAEVIYMLVQWKYQTYSEIKDQPGDSFYIRTMFSRSEQNDDMALNFRKGDILFVDNTLYNNILGQWRAWIVNEDGQKHVCGTIPSKDKVDEELGSQRQPGDICDNSRRSSTSSARRSFFRRKKHSRSSSRDSKELASFSDVSLNAFNPSDVPQSLEDQNTPISYIRVDRLDYLVRRPIVLVGPLWEHVCDKLSHDFPHKFCRCVPQVFRGSTQELDAMIQNGHLVDYRRRGAHFEFTSVAHVKDICDKNCHAVLDVSVSSVVRLHQYNIYPIVLLLKFKHHKQIRDISDSCFGVCERLSQKEAKEMFDLTNKIDQEYKQLISAEIAAGVNLSYICAQVKAIVDTEQSKTLWVPTSIHS